MDTFLFVTNRVYTSVKKLPLPVKLILFVCLAWLIWHGIFATEKEQGRGSARPQPVRVKIATRKNIPVYITALGTVQPINTVIVKSRVDGELMQVAFQEGQYVKAGELLAKIDPRPFEVQLKQAEGALKRDQALLKDAKLTLERYRKLIKESSISVQQLQSQESLVGQYEGAILIDQANIDNAKLQLFYCQITAPVEGRVGLKKIDAGNIIRATDSDGIVTITQMNPMQVTFSIIEKDLPQVLQSMKETSALPVEAYSQGGRHLLAVGQLVSLDNQIDTTTGTVKAKALFDNTSETLYPQQFTNIKLLVNTVKNATVIPSSALQRDDTQFFVYQVIDNPKLPKGAPSQEAEQTSNASEEPTGKVIKEVRIKKVETSYSSATETVISEGIAAGDTVVVDGVDRLRDKSTVEYSLPAN